MTTINRKVIPLLCLILVAGLFLGPVQAAEKYLGESPDLAVSIGGKNEYYPGKEVTVSVLVENRAIPGTKIITPGLEQWPDRPTTAKLIRIALLPGDAPVIIRTDPQMIGDLPLGSSRSVPFRVKILEGATGGTYTLPVDIQYTYLYFSEQFGTDTLSLHYKDVNITSAVEVKVKPKLIFNVTDVNGKEICAGQEGELSLIIKNTGTFPARDAIVRIVRHEKSPVIPVEGSAFIGDFGQGDSNTTKFRIRVSEDAKESVYPLDVVIQYRDDEGGTVETDSEVIGVRVLGKAGFSIEPSEVTIPRGLGRDIELTVRNTGPATLRSAQARLKVIEPFSSSKYTAALGDLEPGEEATVSFSLAVDKAATMKVYGLDTEIQYRDALDNILISSPVTLRVAVVDRSAWESFTTNPVYISIIVAIVLGAIYIWYRRKKG